MRLFHADHAEKMIQKGKILRGSDGLFGGGIYFAESEDIASRKARNHRAMMDAFVALGRTLVSRKSRFGMDYRPWCMDIAALQ